MLETILLSTILLFTTVGVVNEVMRLRINLRRSRELKKSLSVLAEELILLTETKEIFQKNTKLINEKMENDATKNKMYAAEIKGFMEKEYKNFLSFVRETKEVMNGSIVKERYTPVEELHMSNRTTNALIVHGIGSIQELLKYSEEHLSVLTRFGKKTVEEIKEALAVRGLSLTPEKYE